MLDFINDILSYGYLRNALFATILSGIVCGIVGTYVVSRRSLFLAGGITHSSFGGLGIALYLGANPILGATIFAVASSLGIEWATTRSKIREDSAVGIMWAVGMATGALFMSLRPGYTSGDLSSYLFGSIITVTTEDVVSLAIFAAALLLSASLWLRPVMLVAFDRDFARSQGVPTRLISYAMAAVTSLAIVLSIRTMGIILLISLLTLPVVIADTFAKSYRQIVVIAPIVAILGNIAGLYISYEFEVPPGASIIFLLSFTLIIIKVISLWAEKWSSTKCK
ncbi:MAG: metal ABC transporter permease [Rikenellaceae bacterium]